MNPLQGTRRSVLVVLSILCLLGPPVAAQTLEPPFFGPPGMSQNTMPGLVDVDDVPGPSAGDAPAFFSWMATAQLIMVENPWVECAQTPDSFMLTPSMSGVQMSAVTPSLLFPVLGSSIRCLHITVRTPLVAADVLHFFSPFTTK